MVAEGSTHLQRLNPLTDLTSLSIEGCQAPVLPPLPLLPFLRKLGLTLGILTDFPRGSCLSTLEVLDLSGAWPPNSQSCAQAGKVICR